jgi:hypothetical protein
VFRILHSVTKKTQSGNSISKLLATTNTSEPIIMQKSHYNVCTLFICVLDQFPEVMSQFEVLVSSTDFFFSIFQVYNFHEK